MIFMQWLAADRHQTFVVVLCLQEDIEAEVIEKLSRHLVKASSLITDSDLVKYVVDACWSSGNCCTDTIGFR